MFWFDCYAKLPKQTRYSLGQKIDSIFIELIEAVASAAFLSKEEKLPYLRLAMRKSDTLKVLMQVLWETKSFDSKKYISLASKLAEIGKMLGGWYGQISKQSSRIPGAK